VFWEEQLQRVREIRMSERKFYQKITDIYAAYADYGTTAAPRIFFEEGIFLFFFLRIRSQ
jgi:hypothetical protein